MDWVDFVGKHFIDNNSNLYRIIGYDKNSHEFTVYQINRNTSLKISPSDIEIDYKNYKLTFIDNQSYLMFGSIVTHVDPDIDNFLRGTIIYGTNNTASWQQYNPTFTFPEGFHADVAAFGRKDIGGEFIQPICECGGKKVGLKDYQVGHSDWCDVSHTKGRSK